MQTQFSNWLDSFKNSIFTTEDEEFEQKAIELFNFQYHENDIYRQYCDFINCKPEKVSSLQTIPFLPISTFKKYAVKSTSFIAETVFSSSGTTATTQSQHLIKDLHLYKNSFLKGFEKFYGQVNDYCILALLPSYLEREGSSLVYMADQMIRLSKHKESGFFLNNLDELSHTLNQLNKEQKKVLLIGVSFALLDFSEQYKLEFNPNLIVMETGGMKGRRKELIREELHEILGQNLKCKAVHSEYGMTELLSQAYSKEAGLFQSPNWMKVLIRKQDDPFDYCKAGETGAINIIDLANLYSCAFIQTDDLGRSHSNTSFEVLGRFDASDVRGCNLMVN